RARRRSSSPLSAVASAVSAPALQQHTALSQHEGIDSHKQRRGTCLQISLIFWIVRLFLLKYCPRGCKSQIQTLYLFISIWSSEFRVVKNLQCFPFQTLHH
ncbi:unnamed protein product, partial [Larinioides sclopetarius]